MVTKIKEYKLSMSKLNLTIILHTIGLGHIVQNLHFVSDVLYYLPQVHHNGQMFGHMILEISVKLQMKMDLIHH